MKLLRTSWLLGKWCADCLRDVLVCLLWLALGAVLLVQVVIITSRELPVPAWMLRNIERHLDTAGLKIQIGKASIDPIGRLTLQNLQLTPNTFDTPIASIENLRVRLRPLSLLHGKLDPRYVRVRGLKLLLPAMFSSSGQTDAIIEDFNLSFRPDAEKFAPDHCSGRIGNLTFELRGALASPLAIFASPGDTAKFSGLTPAVLNLYVAQAQNLDRFSTALSGLTRPHLSIELLPTGTAQLTLTSSRLETDLTRFHPKSGRLHATGLRLATRLPIGKTLPDSLELRLSCAQATTTGGLRITDADCRLTARPPKGTEPSTIASTAITVSAASLQAIGLRHAVAELDKTATDTLKAELATEMFDALWQAHATADTRTGRASANITGALTNEIVQYIAPHTGLEPDVLMKFDRPVTIGLKLDFGDNWKFARACGHLDGGPLTGYHVPYHAISGDFDFDGTELLCHNLAARQGENHATGSYWMNVKTNQFRFLLAGQARPLGISGYFESWWPNFWNFFDFPAAIPNADVDVAGIWTTPRHTSVFVSADVTRPILNNTHFDRLRATMFIRPHFYHALALKLEKDERSATGNFTRIVDYRRTSGDLKSIDFDITTNLDLQEAARIFGKDGTETVAPFTFATPPNLRLLGRVDGPASERGAHKNIQLELASTGAFTLYDFPLTDVSFNGSIRDDEIILSDIQAAFANGLAKGSARIHGLDTDRRLSFDCTLKNALLGEAISTLEAYSARTRGETPPARSRFQQQNAQGRLNIDLAAQGLYADLFSYFGHGHMEVVNAQLGQVNLLGTLSQLLGKTPLFRFTTLQLKEARCSFVLERDKITFPDLKITGTNAIIDTTGHYRLDNKLVDFTAKLYPFGQGRNPFASAAGFLLVPLTNALELKLSGPIDQPQWRFTYGPTNFLYNITGANPNEDPANDPSKTGNVRKLPQPYIRH